MRARACGALRGGLVRTLLLLGAAALAVFTATGALAQDDSATLERKVKTAFLYKFAGYVEWPEAAFSAPGAPIGVGVAGDEALVSELIQVVAGRTIAGRPLIVRRLREGESLAGIHVLFVSDTERARLAAMVRGAPQQPLLIVTETEGALAHGSAINFLLAGGRVRFEIALDNAEKRGLRLSSRLLSVAQSVRTGATQ